MNDASQHCDSRSGRYARPVPVTMFPRSRAIATGKSRRLQPTKRRIRTGQATAAWSMRNWPVRWKVLAIVSGAAGSGDGLRRIAHLRVRWPTRADLRLAADRAEMVPAIAKYMSALDVRDAGELDRW